MKRDIKVNYGVLKSIVNNLNQYKTALEDMDNTLKNIETRLENENDGEAVNALKSKYKDIKGQVDSCQGEISDLYDIFNNYVSDMTGIIRPKNESQMMRVSRNDIFWNMSTISACCSNVLMTRRSAAVFKSWPSPFADDDEKAAERRNGDKLDNLHNDIINYGNKLMADFNDMNNLYNKKVIPYENMDDTYKTKAKSLYSKYTTFLEGLQTVLTDIGVGAVDLVKGVFASLLGLVKGVFDLVKGVVTYLGAGIGIACTTIFGDAPECLKNCIAKAEEYNKVISTIVQDPFLIIEGLSQNINDAYEEKGICYVTGYAVGEIAQLILLKKAGEKLKAVKGADNTADGVKTVEATDSGADAAKTVDKIDDVADGVKGVESVEAADEMTRIGSGVGKTGDGIPIEEVKPEVLEQIHPDSSGAYGYMPNEGTPYAKPEYDFTDVDWAKDMQDIRMDYINTSTQLQADIDKMTAEGISSEEIARHVVEVRNGQKVAARARMTEVERLGLEARNIEKYGNPIGPTADELFKKAKKGLIKDGLYESDEQVWKIVMLKSMKKDDVINTLLGLIH